MNQIAVRNRLLEFKKVNGTTNQFVANQIKCDRSTISKFTTGKDLPVPLLIKLDNFMDDTIDRINNI